jgi:hypothetical protein
MRIVKMTEHEFEDRDQIDQFFEEYLFKRSPAGKFRMLCTNNDASPKISDNSLSIGEVLIFTFKNDIVWISESASSRIDNKEDEEEIDLSEYPYYFTINMEKNRRVNSVPLKVFEKELKTIYPKLQNLVKSQGWPTIQEDPEKKDRLDILLNSIVTDY